MNQLTKLNNKDLFGINDLPRFMSCEFMSRIKANPSLRLTTLALKQGLPVLASPMVDVEHNRNIVTINILSLTPEISNTDLFCVIELLTPLRFNLSNSFYVGPVQKDNLA